MNKKPLVSVLIVSYNQEEFINECIDSVLEQNYENIEIIISDDASNDKTPSILEKYLEKYPDKIKINLSKKNQGITGNCNSALALCGGDYIALLGGDDYMMKDKISTQVNFMLNNLKCTLSYHNLDVFESKSRKTMYHFNDKNGYINGGIDQLIKHGCFCCGSSVMIKTQDIKDLKFDNRIPVASDWLFFIKALSRGGEILYINKLLGGYRRHGGNVTKKSNKLTQNDLDHLFTISILMHDYPDFYKEINYRYARNLIGLRHKLPYLRTLWTSLILSPNKKSFIGLIMYILTFNRVKL